jgi:hypothetical protein
MRSRSDNGPSKAEYREDDEVDIHTNYDGEEKGAGLGWPWREDEDEDEVWREDDRRTGMGWPLHEDDAEGVEMDGDAKKDSE